VEGNRGLVMLGKILMGIGAIALLVVGSCTFVGMKAIDSATSPEAQKFYKKVENDYHNEVFEEKAAAADYAEREWTAPDTHPNDY
jgi:hypothetical protein